MTNYYQLKLGSLTRKLPIIPISTDTAIASFVLLGDDELSRTAAKLIQPKLPTQFDYIVTVESKGIPFAHDLSLITKHPRSFVIRKSVKGYMRNPLEQSVNSITTKQEQELVLDGQDAQQLRGKKVLLVDDVISTGSSIHSAATLLEKAGSQVVGKVAILTEGDAAKRDDIIFLAKLPLFNLDGTIKA
ncbi:phosphoribosyltransferase family protein [Limosilactobacillus kribbianus]|uniref:phosphoribosyltransferase family protein n=1 Tax=Limosilactobacillus kribbianus TaxID=2982695 RepID=UPI002263D364|nr:phosphoribosyltransferase family protein [Limosilactobacillus kribbianus]